MPEEYLWELITAGKSMSVYCGEPKLYTSSIVGGIIPIALGAAKALKMKNTGRKVWAFVGDMTAETGGFHEAYKYSRRLMREAIHITALVSGFYFRSKDEVCRTLG